MNVRDSEEFKVIQDFVAGCQSARNLRVNDSRIAVSRIEGRQILFSVANPKDLIQRDHYSGRFFEPNELNEIAKVLPKGGVYVDIGANVGNHALYVASFLSPSKIIPFEPNRTAIQVLIENLALNDLFGLFDLSHLGLGLSDSAALSFRLETPHADNLGMTNLAEGGGDIPLTTGDEALQNEPRIDLIKMDVEGMEMSTLTGLKETLARTKPRILIEVDHNNHAAFSDWLVEANYEIETTFQRMYANQNFLIRPT